LSSLATLSVSGLSAFDNPDTPGVEPTDIASSAN
uniref:Transposase n=1 Tax=Anisakis simplex TaxID=6269 RepID=A0A0M3JPA5_ANISI